MTATAMISLCQVTDLAVQRIGRCFLPALALLWLGACVPIPIPGGAVSRAIPEATRAAIKPGSTTRADVLLLLADPYKRGEDDRYFLYSSSQYRGGLLFVALAYYPIPVAEISGHSCRLLAIQFDPAGTVTKVRAFAGKAQPQSSTILDWDKSLPRACETDAELNESIAAWLAEP